MEELNHLPNKIKVKLPQIAKLDSLHPTEEEKQLIESNRSFLEKYLWTWEKDDKFKFKLPPTAFHKQKTVDNSLNNRYRSSEVEYEDMTLVGASFSPEMLRSIWEKGEFEIKSLNEKVPYIWKISKFIIKGYENIKESYVSDIALCFGYVYYLKNRFSTYIKELNFSVSFCSGFYHIYKAIYNTLNLLIGLPIFDNCDHILEKEINSELIMKFHNEHPEINLTFFSHKRYHYITELDYKFNEYWFKKVLPEKEKLFKAQKKSLSEINELKYEAQKSLFLDFMRKEKRYQKFKETYPEIDAFYTSQQVIFDKEHEKKEEFDEKFKEFKAKIKEENYIKVRVRQWEEETCEEFRGKLEGELRKKMEDQVKSEIASNQNVWAVYEFNSSRLLSLPSLIASRSASSPFPQISVTFFRNLLRPYERFQDVSGYSLIRKSKITVSSSHCFWRLHMAAEGYLVDLWNFALLMVRKSVWSSFGMMALWKYSFYLDECVDREGNVRECNEVKCTLRRTINNLWMWIRRSREEFENKPDTGILSKNFSRLINLFINYVFKLLIILPLLLIFYPSFIIIFSSLCFAFFIFSPLIVLFYTFLKYFFSVFVFDFYRGHIKCCFKFLPFLQYSIGYFGFFGIFQVALTTFSLLLLPLSSFFFFIFAHLRFSLRYIYDSCFYYVLKWFGKIPITDTCIAFKIGGPGLFNNLYADLSNQTIILFVRKQLETIVLDHFREKMTKILNEPKETMRRIREIYSRSMLCFEEYNKVNQSISFYMKKLTSSISDRLSLFPRLKSPYSIRFTSERLSDILLLTKRYVERVAENLDINFLLATSEEEPSAAVARRLLKEQFGQEILVPLQENDKILRMKEEYENVIDVVAKSVLEDPYFKNKVYFNENKPQKLEKIKVYPPVAKFKSIFTPESPLFINLSYLSEENRKKIGVQEADESKFKGMEDDFFEEEFISSDTQKLITGYQVI